MDSISLTCPKCKHAQRFPAERAGTEGECVICGAGLHIPQASADDDDDDGGNTGYGLLDVVEEKKKLPVDPVKKREKKAIDPSLKKKKKLQDADKWVVVRGGLTVMSTAAAAWGLIYALQMLVVLFGCTRGAEYNPARLKVLLGITKAEDLNEDVQLSLNRPHFALALLYGTEYLTACRVVQILLALMSIFPIILFVLGYFACSRSPNRFGMHEQVKAMTILAFVNAGILLIFKILPLITSYMPYTPLPYFVPELATLTANSERTVPIQVFWTRFPFFDTLLTILFTAAKFAECTLGGVFIYTMGFTIKDEELRDAGKGLVQLAMGTGFAFIVYFLFGLCGASNILVDVFRVVYLAAVAFQFYFILRYMLVLNQACATLDRKMADMTEEELRWKDEDDPVEDDDEDEEESAYRKKKKRWQAQSDDGDDDAKGKHKRGKDDDEGEDDEDDDRPKSKRKRSDDDDDADDDDRPKRRRKRTDDDDDDTDDADDDDDRRKRKRKRDEEGDDDDDRPRKRTKR